MKTDARRLLRWVGVAVVVLAAVGWIVLWWVAEGLFFWPDHLDHGAAATLAVAPQEVRFAAPDGPPLHGWWLRSPGPRRGVVVYCHGNAANLTLHARYVGWLPAYGFDVLVLDYRGYGRSEGEPTREGLVDDAVAALDLALREEPDRTVVFGHSLGGAIAVVAASRRPAVRAVVAESTFPSFRAAARASAPWLAPVVPSVIAVGCDPETVVGSLAPRPLLVIHGTGDPIVPFRLGRALFDAASEPKEFWEVEVADHFTPWKALGPEFEHRIVEFLGRALGD